MKKMIDINPFKKEGREKLNLLRAAPSEKESSFNNLFGNYWKIFLTALVALLIIFVLLKLLPLNLFNWRVFSGIDPNKLQTVFLTNNQTYFGHISEINKDYLVLGNVYYFKAAQADQANQQLNLVKLSDEIYGPDDELHISNSQVSFWQNLRDDSLVTKMINQMENKADK